VLARHHIDHTGGIRTTFIAEGATVIVPTPDNAYFEKVARMPHTVAPDELAKQAEIGAAPGTEVSTR
jgi:metal-dependent hydrolase (beta-lactamase superfamily II)